MKVRFKVQHQILSGMKYVQVVKRGPISQKTQEMIVRLNRTSAWVTIYLLLTGFIQSEYVRQAILREEV
jgi:hypothetical protein